MGGLLKSWVQTQPDFQDPLAMHSTLVTQAVLFPSIGIKGLVFYLNIKSFLK